MARRFRRKRKTRRGRRKRGPMVKLIKKVIQSQAEHKYIQFITADTSIVVSGNDQFRLTPVAEGTSRDDRIGNNIKVSAIKGRFHIRTADSGVINNVRVYIIQNSTDLVPSDLPGIGDLFPLINEAGLSYKILYDRTFQMSLGIRENAYVNYFISGRKLSMVKFEGAIASTFDKGEVIMFVVSDSIVADDITFSAVHRCMYTDL